MRISLISPSRAMLFSLFSNLCVSLCHVMGQTDTSFSYFPSSPPQITTHTTNSPSPQYHHTHSSLNVPQFATFVLALPCSKVHVIFLPIGLRRKLRHSRHNSNIRYLFSHQRRHPRTLDERCSQRDRCKHRSYQDAERLATAGPAPKWTSKRLWRRQWDDDERRWIPTSAAVPAGSIPWSATAAGVPSTGNAWTAAAL